MGNYDDALLDYNRSLELDGDYDLAYSNRGDLFQALD